MAFSVTYLDWFPPQDEEVFRPHHHEAHEFMAQDLLNLICLQQQIKRASIKARKLFGSCSSLCRFWTEIWLTCFTAMLTLTELMEPSIRTFSLSLRLMITGWRSNSLLLLDTSKGANIEHVTTSGKLNTFLSTVTVVSPDFHLRFVVPFHHLRGEVLQAKSGLQRGTHRVEIRTQSGRLMVGKQEAELRKNAFQ